jgi:hypothetical protein
MLYLVNSNGKKNRMQAEEEDPAAMLFPPPHPPLTSQQDELRERTFGNTRRALKGGGGDNSSGDDGGNIRSAHMVPALSILLSMIVVVWSLNRCIDCSEVFQANRSARIGIVLFNLGVLVVALVVVLWVVGQQQPQRVR